MVMEKKPANTESQSQLFCGKGKCNIFSQKETATGLFANYLGFTPFSYHVGLVRTLLFCTFILSSPWFLFHKKVLKTKHYLEKNSNSLIFAIVIRNR